MDDPQNRNLLIYGVNRGGWKNKHQTYPTLLIPQKYIDFFYFLQYFLAQQKMTQLTKPTTNENNEIKFL
jgi:hypothetical protein